MGGNRGWRRGGGRTAPRCSGRSSCAEKGRRPRAAAQGTWGTSCGASLCEGLGRGPWPAPASTRTRTLTRAERTAAPHAAWGCPSFHRCPQGQGQVRHTLRSTCQAQAHRHTHLRVRGNCRGVGGGDRASARKDRLLPGHRILMPHCSGKSTAVNTQTHQTRPSNPTADGRRWGSGCGFGAVRQLGREAGCLPAPAALTSPCGLAQGLLPGVGEPRARPGQSG